jgi:hypothetical protein
MAERSYKVYPSGFLGASNVRTTRPIDFEKIKEQLFNLSNVSNPDGHTANLRVSSLYERITAGEDIIKTFTFKDAVLRTAATSFGTQNWFDWVKAQASSPYMNEWHSKWIDETIEFVLQGKARTQSTSNWVFLVEGPPSLEAKRRSPVVQKAIDSLGVNLSLMDWVLMWVSREGGIEDLAESLYVLFGPR